MSKLKNKDNARIDFYDTLPISNRSFVYNEQKVRTRCICGEELEIYNNVRTNCECGRLYELTTRVSLLWVGDIGAVHKYDALPQEPPEAEDLNDIDLVESAEE